MLYTPPGDDAPTVALRIPRLRRTAAQLIGRRSDCDIVIDDPLHPTDTELSVEVETGIGALRLDLTRRLAAEALGTAWAEENLEKGCYALRDVFALSRAAYLPPFPVFPREELYDAAVNAAWRKAQPE